MKCTICNHPQRRNLDLALLSRRHTLESLHREFGVSVSALFRHKNHLKENVINARDRLKNTGRQVCLLKLTDLLEHVQQVVRTAEADGNLDRVIRGAYVASRIIQQLDRLEVSLELETVYRLISAPGFVSQDTLLPTDPQVIAELHQAVVDTAWAPCPEPEPALADDDNKGDHPDDYQVAAADPNSVEAVPETQPTTPNPQLTIQNPQPETPLSRRAAVLEVLRLLQRQYPHLDFSPDVLADPEINPKIKRKITEKLPKKMALFIEKMQKYQRYTQCEKNLPKNAPHVLNFDLSAKPPPQPQMGEAPLDLPGASLETRSQRSAISN
jgi:hypothetical protein